MGFALLAEVSACAFVSHIFADFVFTKEGICKGVRRHSFHCGAAYRLICMIGGVCLILEDAVHYDSSPAMRICMNKMCAA